MKALRLEAVGQLARVEIDPPAIAPDQVLLATGAAVICTSDLNDVRANPFGIALPVVMGHEGAGTVVEVGSAVCGLKVGDRVAAHPVHPCRKCANCRAGMEHLCADMGHFGLNMPGTFAEYFVVREDRARVLPADVPFAVAALAEPVCVCLEALAQARLSAGARLLIIGDGPFGAMMARLARPMGLGQVVVAGRHDFRLGFAAPAVTVNTKNAADPVAALKAHAGELGYDAVILAAGSPESMHEALAVVRPKGRVVVFSSIAGRTPIDLFDVQVREVEIVGACNDDNRLDDAVAKLSDPSLGLGDLVTHTLGLDEYERAFALAGRGREEAMKVAFTFPEAPRR